MPGLEILEGTCGGGFTSVGCLNNTSGVINGLTIGTLYYMIIWDDGTNGSIIDWCLEIPPPPPPNDICATAIDYTTAFGAIGAEGTCPANEQTLNITEFTDSGIDPTCDFGGDATAWYTWTATANGISFDSGAGGPVSYTHLTLPTICSV